MRFLKCIAVGVVIGVTPYLISSIMHDEGNTPDTVCEPPVASVSASNIPTHMNIPIEAKTEAIERVTKSSELREEKGRKVVMNVSAYTPDDDENGGYPYGVTASGITGTPHLTCASDDLPFGTRVKVHGRVYIVQDRFGGGYTNRLDLMMETKEQCYNFGRQYIEVEILDEV